MYYAEKILPGKFVVLFFLAVFLSTKVFAQINFQNKKSGTLQILHKADSVLSMMTLEEKIGQLSIFGSNQQDLAELIKAGKVGGTNGMLPGKKDVRGYLKNLQQLAMQSRLKIPLLFMGDVIHGYRTCFPVNIAQSCSWDTALVTKANSAATLEATSAGMNWTFAPMLDISRDPRWGRVVEGAGEDPFLGAAFAVAAVRGFQGNDLSARTSMAATAKHFAAYGAVEGGRDYNTVNVPERLLREIYLPPFRAAIDAGLASVMPAFISLNGIPAPENNFLLKKILREDFKFKGVTVSDYDAISELLEHGVVADSAGAAMQSINAGMDMDLHSGTYLSQLPCLVNEGKVSEETINASVKNVLALKFKLGLFDNPIKNANSSLAYEDSLLQKHRPLARQLARESIVLLKNENQILPLSKSLKTIAVIGPLARDQKNLLGPVHALGKWEEAISVWQGIKKAVASETNLLYAKGCEINSDSTEDFSEAITVATRSDAVILVLGEDAGMSGEGDSRSDLGLPGNQLDLVKAIMKTGKPVIVLLMNGRPLAIPWLNDHANAILETWFAGTEAGNAIADVLFGDYNPSGKLTMSFPRNTGQIPVYYNHLNTGRPFQKGKKYTSRYIDIPNSPLYPFGYGLSYTTFSYSPIHLNTTELNWNDTLKISVKITNTGKMAGTEIAQLYIHDLVAEISRPVKELKGFQRVSLKPGESAWVSFILTRKDLAFFKKDRSFEAEPGDFSLFIGGSSDTDQQTKFSLKKY
jgi:beta-glucosidase